MGKPTEGNVKGAQEHAEGQHGRKTLDRLQELNASGGVAGFHNADEAGERPEQGEGDATRRGERSS